MHTLLAGSLTLPMLGSVMGAGFALTLLALLLALAVYAGLYYSIPRLLLKRFSRRVFITL